MKPSALVLSATLPTWGVAHPAVAAKPATACEKHHLHALREDPKALPFCSSYLSTSTTVSRGASTVTKQTTIPSTTVIVTSTVTDIATASSTTTQTVTVTLTSTMQSFISCASSASSLFIYTSIHNPEVSSSAVPSSSFAKRDAVSPTPKYLGGKPSATISSLCSCLGVAASTSTITVPTTTETVTSTVSSGGAITSSTVTTTTATTTDVATVTKTKREIVHTTIPAFVRGALNYSLYYNPYNFEAQSPPNVDTTIFKNNNYALRGVVYTPAAIAPRNTSPNCRLDDGKQYNHCDQMTAVIQGYFVPRQSGSYTFTTGGNSQAAVDNWVSLWTGDKAYSSWNNGNADFIAIRSASQQTGGTFTIHLEQGQLTPITIMYMNGGGSGTFQFSVITPDGVTQLNPYEFWLLGCPNAGFQP